MSLESIIVLVVAAVIVGMLALVVRRLAALTREVEQGRAVHARLDALAGQNERLEREFRVELAIGRNEAAQQATATRTELASNLAQFAQGVHAQLASISSGQDERLKSISDSNER